MFRSLAIVSCLLSGAAVYAAESTAEALRELTGGRTRVVWLQDVGDGSDYLAQRGDLRIMAFDTEDGRGERVLVGGPRNAAKPMFTPDGQRVVFSDRHRGEMWMVDWEGREPQSLGPGFALHVWRDPATSVDWLYYAKPPVDDGKVLQTHQAIYRRGLPPFPRSARVLLDRLRGRFDEEELWALTHVSEDNFQVSGDGRFASTVFPWPEAGILDLDTGDWHRFGRGCWVSLAPDTSYFFWIFDGPHRNLIMHRAGRPQHERWPVFVAGLPETSDYEVYHPRWANHPFILTVTGPYKIGEGSHRLAGGGGEVEVHVGRFNADHTAIDRWVTVTDNPQANFYPDVWVEHTPVQLAAFTNRLAETAARDAAWPVTRKGIAYLWENLDGLVEVRGAARGEGYLCRPEPVGFARYDRHLGMYIDRGAFVDADAGAKALAAIDKSRAFTLELTLQSLSHETPEGEAWLAAFLLDDRTPFVLGIEAGRLFHRVNGNTFVFDRVSLNRSHHLAVTYGEGRLIVYLDGEPLLTELAGEIALDGSDRRLGFGGHPAGRHTWAGRIDGIALYDRVLDPGLIRTKSALRLAELSARQPADRLVVRGRLTATTAIPHPDDIAPYRRALISHEYEVTEVVEGAYDEPDILVASWAILDGTVLDGAARELGEERELVLERFDDRPELEGERLAMDTDNLLLDLYFEPEIP